MSSKFYTAGNCETPISGKKLIPQPLAKNWLVRRALKIDKGT